MSITYIISIYIYFLTLVQRDQKIESSYFTIRGVETEEAFYIQKQVRTWQIYTN